MATPWAGIPDITPEEIKRRGRARELEQAAEEEKVRVQKPHLPTHAQWICAYRRCDRRHKHLAARGLDPYTYALELLEKQESL